MQLDQFTKATTQVALSNIANGRKARTPLIASLFKFTKPSKTTAVELVYDTATGKVLPIGDRANSNNKTAGNTIGKKTRHAKTLSALHVTAFETIDSDEIQDIPEPTNKESLESFNSYVNGEVNAIEEHLEATREFHAMGALNGAVRDTDDSEAYNLFDLFGLTKNELTLLVSELNAEDGLRKRLMAIKSHAKKKLRGKIIKGFLMLCGENAYTEYALSTDTKKDMRNNKLKYVVDGFDDGFNYQNVDFVEYDGGIGERAFLGEHESILIPIIDGLFCITPTPGKGTNHVNKRGQKTYITTEEQDHGVGVELKGQSNYVVYVEVPDALTYITLTPDAEEAEEA
jgi:hypothetical protein